MNLIVPGPYNGDLYGCPNCNGDGCELCVGAPDGTEETD